MIVDDAVGRKRLFANLELRFDQQDHLSLRGNQLQRWQDQGQRNERDVGNDNLKTALVELCVGTLAQRLESHFASVDPLKRNNLRVVQQLFDHLVVTNVNSNDLASPRAQQHVGETTGRSADIEANLASNIDFCELLESLGKLVTRSRNVFDCIEHD